MGGEQRRRGPCAARRRRRRGSGAARRARRRRAPGPGRAARRRRASTPQRSRSSRAVASLGTTTASARRAARRWARAGVRGEARVERVGQRLEREVVDGDDLRAAAPRDVRAGSGWWMTSASLAGAAAQLDLRPAHVLGEVARAAQPAAPGGRALVRRLDDLDALRRAAPRRAARRRRRCRSARAARTSCRAGPSPRDGEQVPVVAARSRRVVEAGVVEHHAQRALGEEPQVVGVRREVLVEERAGCSGEARRAAARLWSGVVSTSGPPGLQHAPQLGQRTRRRRRRAR